MALIDDFKARFTEFTEAQADTYIPILESVWPCYYGGEYEGCGVEIVLNLVAHLLVAEVSGGSGTVKSTQSQSVGSVSVSYANSMASDSLRTDWLRSTKYGQRYLMLTRSRQGGVFV